MPGIFGMVSCKEKAENKKDLETMLGSMIHENFYTSGMFIKEDMDLYVGWVSRKESFSDCMPLYNETRDIVLLFSGENFTDIQLIKDLKQKGHEFDTSKANYLVHLYEEKGEAFLKVMNGGFNGLIVDLKKKKALLFNDRIGTQKMYFYENGEELLFSTEAKSLLKIRPSLKELSMPGLGQYLTSGCVYQNRTLFPKIGLLPGGSVWTFTQKGRVEKSFYFKPDDWEKQPPLQKDIFYKKLREKFKKILPKYFGPKEKIAISLTGGLDTRIIMACMEKRPNEYPCYTFGGPYGDSLDVRIARVVANACQQQHQVFRLEKTFFNDFPSHAEKTVYLSDGCLDVVGSHEIFANKLAREVAPVRMTGNYGSEVLRSHSVYGAHLPLKEPFDAGFYTHVSEAAETFKNIKLDHSLTDAVFREIPWLLSGRLSVEQTQLTIRTPYIDNDLLKLVYQAPAGVRGNNEMSLRLIADNNSDLININTNEGVIDGSNNLISRVAQLYNYFLYKADYYYDFGMTKWMAKVNYALSPLHIEKLFIGIHRLHHYRIWFQNELSDFVRDVLLDQRTKNRPYLNSRFLEKMAHHHIKGDRNYAPEINKILTVELIQRLFIEGN